MNMISRYIDSLLDLPTWIGFPIFMVSVAIPLFCTIWVFIFLLLSISPWFILLPVALWAACAINWWIKNK
jgi:hypothetical protein